MGQDAAGRWPRHKETRYRWAITRPIPDRVRQTWRIVRGRAGLAKPARAMEKPLATIGLALYEVERRVEARVDLALHPALWWARSVAAERLWAAVLDLAAAWPWGVDVRGAIHGERGGWRWASGWKSSREASLFFGEAPEGGADRTLVLLGTALHHYIVQGVPVDEAVKQALAVPLPLLAAGTGRPVGAEPVDAKTVRIPLGRLESRPPFAWLAKDALWEAALTGRLHHGFRVEVVRTRSPHAMRGAVGSGKGRRWYVPLLLNWNHRHRGRYVAEYVERHRQRRPWLRYPWWGFRRLGATPKAALAVFDVWPEGEKALLLSAAAPYVRGDLAGDGDFGEIRLGLRLRRASLEAVQAVFEQAVAMVKAGQPLEVVRAWIESLGPRDAEALVRLKAAAGS